MSNIKKWISPLKNSVPSTSLRASIMEDINTETAFFPLPQLRVAMVCSLCMFTLSFSMYTLQGSQVVVGGIQQQEDNYLDFIDENTVSNEAVLTLFLGKEY